MKINQIKLFFILLLIMFFLSGCSRKSAKGEFDLGESALAEQRSLIEKHISDPDKEAQLMAVVNETEALLKEFSRENRRHQRHIRELTANYDVTKEDFESAVGDFDAKFEAFLKNMIAKRMALKELTTPEEWQMISQRKKSYVN